MIRWTPAGEAGLRCVAAEQPSPELTQAMLRLREEARAAMGDAWRDGAIGYTTLTVFWHPDAMTAGEAWALLSALALRTGESLPSASSVVGKSLTLPVLYDPEVAPDLEFVAEQKQISVETLIALHCEAPYFAYANGFAPGFSYLGELHPRLAMPRRATPRPVVPAGSVAIADRQTAVYPCHSPGGWHILGRCPVPLFNLEKEPPTVVNVGDWVRFQPISKADFLALGGAL